MLFLTKAVRAGMVGSTLTAMACVPASDEELRRTRPRMEFAAPEFYAAPFPSDHRLADGRVDLTTYPNPAGTPVVDQLVSLLDGVESGFSLTAGVFFSLDGPIDVAGLPDLASSIEPNAAVQLVSIDPNASEFGRRYPITTHFETDGGPHGAAHMLSLVPLQGIPLAARGTYAAVVTTALRDTSGVALAAAPAIGVLAAGGVPNGMTEGAAEAYRDALQQLATLDVDSQRVAGLAVFTTGDPSRELAVLLDAARQRPLPAVDDSFVMTDSFDDYCVYESTVTMPVFQQGEAPYADHGGNILFQSGGAVFDHDESARIVVTVPRGAMPAAGWPTAVFIRTGGGGDRPLVDRGVRLAPGGDAAEPGTGPARYFAEAGFAGVSVDGPHGGLRNITGGDEQFLMFNVSNVAALRDNVRQSAMEVARLVDVLDALSLSTAGCTAGNPTSVFDMSRLALMGHSMGATIAPLTLAVEPRFAAAIFSGAGGSFIENAMFKTQPIAVKPVATLLLGYAAMGRELHRHDPALSLFQWATEVADPPVYAPHVTGALAQQPRHVLMLQGIVDNYILPPIANATSLSLGLDLALPALDETHDSLRQFTPLATLLEHSGATTVTLPAAGNRQIAGLPATAIVVQHEEDGVEDGHEVVFQTPLPKREYRCFLATLGDGAPHVVGPGELDSPWR